MHMGHPFHWLAFAAAYAFVLVVTATGARADTIILNASYDVARELYKDINPAFAAAWKARTGETLAIRQSHGPSSKQALSVTNGLEAHVVAMNQEPDIDLLAERGGLVAADWRQRLPFGAIPYTTVTVFLVRKGNPKGIKDWSDFARAGVSVVVPNPKTSGNGRYTYLAAWGHGIETTGSEAGARDLVQRLFANVPVFDGGGRGATTTFTQREVGDVLVTFESEAILIGAELGAGAFEIVYPSTSIEAAPPVAVVESVTAKRGTRKVTEAYLEFLFSPEGQKIIAKHHFRPRDPAVLAANAARFPAIKTLTVEGRLGGWAKVQKEHFADGGIYDQILVRR